MKDSTNVLDAHANIRIHHDQNELREAIQSCETLRQLARLSYLNKERLHLDHKANEAAILKQTALVRALDNAPALTIPAVDVSGRAMTYEQAVEFFSNIDKKEEAVTLKIKIRTEYGLEIARHLSHDYKAR